MTGHLVDTIGHFVITALQIVSRAGHLVAVMGHWVYFTTQRVFTGGHLVIVTGHCVSTQGEIVGLGQGLDPGLSAQAP